jgi:hypothetical protein
MNTHLFPPPNEGPGSHEDPDSELPPPPPLSHFVEYGALRILGESGLGAALGGILLPWIPGFGTSGGNVALEPGQAGLLLGGVIPFEVAGAVVGAVLAPIALLLTPQQGSRGLRAFRYGMALAVAGMLLASFLGPGRERPLSELLLLGGVLLGVGSMIHGFRVGESPPPLLDSQDRTP